MTKMVTVRYFYCDDIWSDAVMPEQEVIEFVNRNKRYLPDPEVIEAIKKYSVKEGCNNDLLE